MLIATQLQLMAHQYEHLAQLHCAKRLAFLLKLEPERYNMYIHLFDLDTAVTQPQLKWCLFAVISTLQLHVCTVWAPSKSIDNMRHPGPCWHWLQQQLALPKAEHYQFT